jgi:hypothetical protein
MKPQLRRVGESRNPVVVIDDFCGDVGRIARIAEGLAPFPRLERSYYPGVRRVIGEADAAAYAYVEQLCTDSAQFIAGAFDVDGFDLLEASFSLVTTKPEELAPLQRVPHFDSTDPKYFALLHYLRVPPGSGTAFFRQCSTGIEQVSEINAHHFIDVATAESAKLPTGSGYFRGSTALFEQIGEVEAVPDRLIIYRGSLLHSGIIPPGMNLSADPGQGRLTANIFVKGH